jgi:hypothetical protein
MGRDAAAYLREVTSDVWYFETIVMLASLLDERRVGELIGHVLAPDPNATLSAYRAILAADCLESSVAGHSRQLDSAIFAALMTSIEDPGLGAVEKVEAWHALRALQLTDAEVDRLVQTLSMENRFVLEQALVVLGFLSERRLPHGELVAEQLLIATARIAAVDRLREYGAWVYAPAFRSARLTGVYALAWLWSLVAWLGPAPLVFLVTAILVPWFVAGVFAVVVIVGGVYLWFNEDKRSSRAFLRAMSDTVHHLERTEPKPPQIPVRTNLGPPSVAVAAAGLSEYDKWSLLNLVNAVGHANDPVAFLNAEGLAPAPAPGDPRSKDDIREALRDELSRAADLTDDSVELHYKMPRAAVAELCACVVRGDVPVLETIARDVILPRRRAARRRRTPSNLQYASYAADAEKNSPGKESQQGLVSAAEAEFMLQQFTAHNTSCILLANGYIDFDLVDAAEQCGAEAWLVTSAQLLVREVKQMIASSGHGASRQVVRRALLELAPGLDGTAERAAALSAAMQELDEGTLRGFERIKALRSVATLALIVGAVIMAGAMVYYSQRAPMPSDPVEDRFNEAPVPNHAGSKPVAPPDTAGAPLPGRRPDAAPVAGEPAGPAADGRTPAEGADRPVPERYHPLRAGVLFVALVVLPALTWVCWRYLLPRLGLIQIDPSMPSGVSRLIDIATDQRRDMDLRKSAVRRLAMSDDGAARKGLEDLANAPTTSEPLSIEAHKVLHNVRRRQMRTGSR